MNQNSSSKIQSSSPESKSTRSVSHEPQTVLFRYNMTSGAFDCDWRYEDLTNYLTFKFEQPEGIEVTNVFFFMTVNSDRLRKKLDNTSQNPSSKAQSKLTFSTLLPGWNAPNNMFISRMKTVKALAEKQAQARDPRNFTKCLIREIKFEELKNKSTFKFQGKLNLKHARSIGKKTACFMPIVIFFLANTEISCQPTTENPNTTKKVYELRMQEATFKLESEPRGFPTKGENVPDLFDGEQAFSIPREYTDALQGISSANPNNSGEADDSLQNNKSPNGTDHGVVKSLTFVETKGEALQSEKKHTDIFRAEISHYLKKFTDTVRKMSETFNKDQEKWRNWFDTNKKTAKKRQVSQISQDEYDSETDDFSEEDKTPEKQEKKEVPLEKLEKKEVPHETQEKKEVPLEKQEKKDVPSEKLTESPTKKQEKSPEKQQANDKANKGYLEHVLFFAPQNQPPKKLRKTPYETEIDLNICPSVPTSSASIGVDPKSGMHVLHKPPSQTSSASPSTAASTSSIGEITPNNKNPVPLSSSPGPQQTTSSDATPKPISTTITITNKHKNYNFHINSDAEKEKEEQAKKLKLEKEKQGFKTPNAPTASTNEPPFSYFDHYHQQSESQKQQAAQINSTPPIPPQQQYPMPPYPSPYWPMPAVPYGVPPMPYPPQQQQPQYPPNSNPKTSNGPLPPYPPMGPYDPAGYYMDPYGWNVPPYPYMPPYPPGPNPQMMPPYPPMPFYGPMYNEAPQNIPDLKPFSPKTMDYEQFKKQNEKMDGSIFSG